MEPQAIRSMGTSDPSELMPMQPSTADTTPLVGSTEAANRAVEAAHAPSQPALPGVVPVASAVPQHLQTNAGPQVGATPGMLTAAGTPALADDADLIEKEWVVRAKQIVEQTKNDPYLQSAELNKMKAEYIKKRYNKEIKLPES